MKKILAAILCLAMMLSLGVSAGATDLQEAETDLPAVGDTVEGFTVREVRPFPAMGADLVLFEHDRTGAELMYIANSDTDRVFDLTFFTRAVDNTGLPHVFEHSTLSGSEKYPSKALFFNLSYQTYNTYMNAMTSQLFTTYPVSSLSEEQLLRYADFYTDSCLHPSIMTDESIYREEAWRYRLDELDDPLTIEGTVYSEMLGATNIDTSARYNLMRTMFPGSTVGNSSGGDPQFIPDMTWETLKEYHNTYYHPSNCMAFLYGQFEDYTAFLKLLDEAFAPYERREFTFEDPDYTPITEGQTVEFAFPVEASSGTDYQSVVYYAFPCPGLKDDPEEENVLNTLTDLLVDASSPLMQALRGKINGTNFLTFIDMDGPEDVIEFYGSNMNPEDAARFKDIVDTVLADVAANGFSQELVDGVMTTLAMDNKLAREEENVGVNLIDSIAACYAPSGDPFNYVNYIEALDKLDEWNSQGRYAEAVSKWLLGCETPVLVTTYPQAGLREELDAAEADRLAQVKAGMSQEELQAIVEASNRADETDDSAEYLAQLQAVTVSSLPEEKSDYEVTEVFSGDNIRYLSAPAGVDGVGQSLLLLDASGLSQEDLHWFALYTTLLSNRDMSTSEHSREELSALMTRYLNNTQIRLSLVNDYGTDEFHPYLRASWTSTDEDLATGYDLIYELLFSADFSDAEYIAGLVTQFKAGLKSSITSAPYTAMLYRCIAAASPLYAYYNYFNFLDYYAFLESVEQQAAEDPTFITEKLQAVQSYFHNRTNAVSCYAGSEEGIALNTPLARNFFARLDARPVEKAEYSFEPCAKNEALVIDSTVQFNGVVTPDLASIGLEYTADLEALSALITDDYLYPNLRDQYGVYGVFHGFLDDGGAYLISYRDPNVQQTFDVYDALPEHVASLEMDQDDLDGYILSAYSTFAAPEGELTGALNAVLDVLSGTPSDQILQYMRELKSFNQEKLQSYADAYAKMTETGYRFTAGSASAIEANADLYDVVLNPFGAVDATQVELTDVPESHEYYEAVRFMFENQVMFPREDGSFGVDESATLGDLAGALYALMGEDPTAQDEAVELLSSYGILPPTAGAADELTDAVMEQTLTTFSQTVQVPFQPREDVTEDVVTRGALSQRFMDYYFEALA